MRASMFAIAKLLTSARNGANRRWLHAVLVGATALGLGAGAVAWLALHPARAAAPPRALVPPGVDAGEPALALVFVSGAVVRPGLYRLSPTAHISDAISAAGGLRPDADPGHLPNLAAPIHEGKQVNVPFQRTTTRAAARLDVNTATLDELRAIPTMPVGLAEAIVDYRNQFGLIRSLTELRTMLGVDGPTVTGLRPYLYVAPVAP
jgi:competence protein ComEA